MKSGLSFGIVLLALLLLLCVRTGNEQICFAEVLTQEDQTAEGNEDQQEISSENSIAEKLAEERIEAAGKLEPEITAILQSLESENAKLTGLEHRIKSKESLTRKILSDAHDMEISLEEAAAGIKDVVRYTLCINEKQYIPIADETLKTLEENQFSVIRFRNTWGGDGYKGINTNLQTEDGFIFELHFLSLYLVTLQY